MSEENVQSVAEELAALKRQAEESARVAQESEKRAQDAESKAAEAHSYMEGIKKAALGETNAPKQRAPQEVFVDEVLSKGDAPIRNVIHEELQRRAYLDDLRSNFQKNNPHLEPMKDEVFNMADAIVNNAARQGQQLTHEAALKAARDHYDAKHKSILKVAGANANPFGSNNMPQSRYAGCEVDYFEMTDKDFKKNVMDKKDADLKKRQRDRLAYYGAGR